MQREDNMRVVFKNDAQRRCFEVLAERTISHTRYPDFSMLVALGLTDSVQFMFTQMSWDRFSDAKHPTYRNLTLEFLSSFNYRPNLGLGPARGIVSFRLFGRSYRLNQGELAWLLGFQHGPHVYSEVPTNDDLQFDLNYSGVGLQKIIQQTISE